ncbi:MAG: Hsp20/alpha crystallin family protein [Nitrososphaerota archaeon]|jgi:HSP20 family molecular chaperone IbpA|nr:Hsp20/alpha crystallin family protein [Nitrososphaerota archaeon]
MSAKWRRSTKNRKWLDFIDDAEDIIKSKSLRESIKPVKHVRSIPSFRTPKSFSKRKFGDPKPLIDIFQENNWITIIAEIAGFNKESFKINVKDQKITLSAKSKERRYYKSLNLPKVVIPSDIHTTFKNGVLEIKLKKAEIHNKQ